MGNFIYNLTLSFIPIIFAITVHEVAHGWTAKKYGDLTAYNQGRITLNPISHIDPIGTIIIPLLSYLIAGFAFGWAKPVPVNFSNLKNPKKDMAIVAFAGPFSNFLMAIIWTIVLVISTFLAKIIDLPMFKMISEMSIVGFYVNIFFMLLNLLPIPPLDGSRILDSFLPYNLSYKFQKIEPYGMFIILGLAMTGILTATLKPISVFFAKLILAPAFLLSSNLFISSLSLTTFFTSTV